MATDDTTRNPTGYTTGDLRSLIARGLRYQTILADPPWRYDDRTPRGGAELHYPTMTLDEIAALPVRELAADDAHLHLWATHSFLFDAKRVMEAWGFTYKSIFCWVKPTLGNGHYWRSAAEFLLLGVRGDCPFRDHSIRNWICVERGRHSDKPDQVRTLIERASPPPYLELFGRRAVHGWTVFGNEIELGLFDEGVVALE